MKRIEENLRGLRRLVGTITYFPFVCKRMIAAEGGKSEARQIMFEHFQTSLNAMGVTVKTSGTPAPKGKGAVLCYNEASLIDAISIVGHLWPHAESMSGADMWKFIPYLERAFQKAEIDLVPRGNRAANDLLLSKMAETVKAGNRLVWGGEGKLSRFDGVGHFKRGAALIAIRARAPIYPVAFHGGHHILPAGRLRMRKGTVHMRFGAPLETTGLTDEDARSFSDRLQQKVAALYAQLKDEMNASTRDRM
ncbi:MAG: lysophospholipid acyltransferase family protein [Pseudomonadota bacterium]